MSRSAWFGGRAARTINDGPDTGEATGGGSHNFMTETVNQFAFECLQKAASGQSAASGCGARTRTCREGGSGDACARSAPSRRRSGRRDRGEARGDAPAHAALVTSRDFMREWVAMVEDCGVGWPRTLALYSLPRD
jgi:hypothetical protein